MPADISGVVVHPRASPAQADQLRLLFRIKGAEYTRGFNESVVLGNRSACRIAFWLKDVFLLNDSVAPDTVSPVVLDFHQRETSTL